MAAFVTVDQRDGDGPEDRIARFFTSIGPWSKCYRAKSFSYFGQRIGNTVNVHAGRVRLRWIESPGPRQVEVGEYVAGRIPLAHIGGSAQQVFERMANGDPVQSRSGLIFQLAVDSRAGLYVEPPSLLHPEGVQAGRRFSVLALLGGTLPIGSFAPDIDWALRAARTPFDSLTDLLMNLELAGQTTGRSTLDIVADTPVEILQESRVQGKQAQLGICLLGRLRRCSARLTYTVYDKGRCVTRGSREGRALQWKRHGAVSIGTAVIDVPPASLVHCHAIYANAAHHSYWIMDPDAAQNPRLAAFEVVDKGQQLLRSYLLPSENRGSAQYQFESAVAWALWALGLAVVQTDRADQAKDGPDILAVSPGGGQLVVECTLGVLKEGSKLAKVARRAHEVRDRLRAAGAAGTAVIPVLVTALPRQQVAAELESAVEAGVVVVAREELESTLNEVLLFPDGERVFQRFQDTLRSARDQLTRRRREETVARQGGGS